MNKLFTQLVEKRHLDDSFLHPKYENLIDPYKLPDMDKAVNRIKQALVSQERILIYGDYDVDGVTASTLMENALKLAGANPDHLEIMLPDRFVDGYGMSPRLVNHAKTDKINLVITVDCGSRNHEIIDALRAAKVDTIVTDHHECGDTLPNAVAIINPKRPDYAGPVTLKDLAGVGVAFKVAQALVGQGLIPAGQEKWLLDLVLLGTICDSMQLTGENRILTYFGLKVLEKTRRPGLQELIRTAKTTHLNSEAVGFQLGPRLNAAGRLETAEFALNLLRTDSAATAASLAAKLEELNTKRRTEQRAATAEIAARDLDPATPVIIEPGDWNEGIIGIVAGRLVENYHKPAFVLTTTEDGTLKGSGRSFGDFSLAAALDYAKDAIIGGGGHAGAAGVRIAPENLEAFRTKITEYYHSLHLVDQDRYLKIAPDLTITSLTDFTLDFLDDLSLLEPFGPGNLEPAFQVTNTDIALIRRMGAEGQHLRLDIKDTSGKILKLVAFSAPESWLTLDEYTPHDFLIRPCVNEWNGVRSAEARLLDIL